MQEVTIRQRSAFKHFVNVDQPGKELCWNFFTRRKNISFGLYRKVNRAYGETGTYVLQSGTLREVGKSFVVVGSDGDEKTSAPSSPLVPRSKGTTSAVTPPEFAEYPPGLGALKDNASAKSFSESTEGSASGRRRKKESFIDPELVEIMPVTHYDSSKFTVKGSFYVEEPGIYVLLWDNTFSMNTSKKLFFFVALKDVEPSQAPVRKEMENWLLKKGNKKMQGFQKRWVTVDTNGTLSYYKHPGSFCRGSVELPKAAVHLDHDRSLIDIDSGQALYHFKAQSPQDFQAWISVLQRFTLAKTMSLGRESESGGKLIPDDDDAGSPWDGTAKGAMDPDLGDVQRKAENMVITLTNELGRLKELVESSRGRMDQRSQMKDFTLILNSISDVIANALSNANNMQRELYSYGETVRSQRERSHDAIQQTESALHACLADNNRVRRRFGLEPVTLTSFIAHASTTSLHLNNFHKAGSITSSMRDDVFYDAEEGGDSDDEESVESDSMHEAEEGLSSDEEFEDDDEGSNESFTPNRRSRQASTASTSGGATVTQPIPPAKDETSKVAMPIQPLPIVRRTKLPAPTVSMQNVSIMGILRNNVGKDLSTVAMPIALNEPLNLLQKLCEELEYCELLDQAASITDPVDRLALIAAFAVSGYASTIHRAGRKPFNPLLGETYECVREDKGFKFVSEKVSHHPPIMACHAESPNYIFFQDSQVKTKFWGKSMELIPTGTVHVAFPALGEHYTWTKVTTCMRNVFSSGRYLEHYGIMKITSHSSGHYCELSFKESGYFASAKNEVVGTICGPKGQKLMSLSGNWDKSLQKFHESAPNALEVVWRARPNPPNHPEIYGFTSFALELNELTPDLEGLLPITDTRYRPDQRMYEEGRDEEAEREKQRLEQKQRDHRKMLESRGEQWHPQWFDLRPEEYSNGNRSWHYKGGYWEARGKFEKVLDLWSSQSF
ncbi:hypothetical protein SpCBS45565_g07040 [Spizellomyces sp. 'palustris']|nr:hypothetical protein SpCBS45565_g07040 [Spizellomyces sp. 'palustris']